MQWNMGDHQDNDHDHDDDALQPQIWTFTVLAASIPLFWMGNWGVGLCFVLIALMYMAAGNLTTKIPEQDQIAIKYNVWSATDIVEDLSQRCQETNQPRDETDDNVKKQMRDRYRTVALAALAALAKKYGSRQRQQQKQRQHRPQQPSLISTKTAERRKKQDDVDNDDELNQMSRSCQEAVYMCLKSFGSGGDHDDDDDAVIAASFALLALVAKSGSVRERHVQQADAYGLDVLVRCMTEAMKRAREYDDDANKSSDRSREQAAAELQRKACLMLGALSDGDAGIAHQVVQEGGLKAILDAVSWFRFHQQVANWALWAVFILCYENSVNKVTLVQLDGVPIVLEALKHCPGSVEVARHGTAILFDLLREQNIGAEAGDYQPRLDVWKIRNTALAAGLHEILLHAIKEFSGISANMDIILMGREILVGTGYQGVIPEPQISHVRS